MKWKTKISHLVFEYPGVATVTLQIEELEDLEATIDTLFIEHDRTQDSSLLEDLCPYFGRIWPAARVLGKYILEQSSFLDGNARVLEIGCGLAIPSMILAKTHPSWSILASDFHPDVPGFLEMNLARNQIASSQVPYLAMDWRNPSPDLGRFDWVIGSDVLYEKTHPGDLAETLTRLVSSGGRITLTDPARPYLQSFLDQMKARGFAAESFLRDEVWIVDFQASSPS